MRRITRNEFEALMPLADPDRVPVRQFVRNFVWRNQYFSHVRTVDPPEMLEYVEVTTTKEHKEVELPPWLPIGKEVTDQLLYTSFARSKRVLRV